MVYVEGVRLRNRARQMREYQNSNLLPRKKAFGVLTQVAEGLDAAHRKGIVQQVVKQDNVMITAEGEPRSWTSDLRNSPASPN